MRILSVIIANPLRKVNGASIAGQQLSMATSKLIDLDLAVMWDKDETVQVDGLTLYRRQATTPIDVLGPLVPRFVRIPLYRSDIPRLIASGGYDLIHIHNLVPTFAAGKIAATCLEHDIPYVVSAHGFHELANYANLSQFRYAKKVMAELAIVRPARKVIHHADGIFCLTDRDFSLLETSLPTNAEVTTVVTNGVDEFFLQRASESELDEVRERFRLGSDRSVIRLFYMGSLYTYKGADVFLRALQHLPGPFQAVIGGTFRDKAHKESLIREARVDQSARTHLVFTGSLSREQLRAIYQLADIFVYPTKGDSLPLVVLEAMASGLPVVATNLGGIPYAVTSETGILVPPHDARAVADAVNALAIDPHRRRRLGLAGRQRVEGRFRWSQAARAAVEGYRAVLEARQTPTRPDRGLPRASSRSVSTRK